MYKITVMPQGRVLTAGGGETLHTLLARNGLIQDAPCGGQGICGKCKVILDSREVLACRTILDRDMVVTLVSDAAQQVLTDTLLEDKLSSAEGAGYRLAVDIGTTTLAACLLDGTTGRELSSLGMLNPQSAYGADVVSRLRHAQNGYAQVLTDALRNGLNTLVQELCIIADILPESIEVVSAVGNPAMQQLFLGMDTENLTRIPFAPILTQAEWKSAAQYIPCCTNGKLQIVPDISAYVGADTVACMLAADLDRGDALTLLVDIGTNGEMVLADRHKIFACSTAAGPALEGANIRFGMRARDGAISRVRKDADGLHCKVIGGGEAEGICGSGLIDAVAAALNGGLLNERGKILHPEGVIRLTERVHLTQEDIHEVQLAKGAIAAGIELLAAARDVSLEEIDRVYLAGAFGSFLDPSSACRIGLIPPVLENKITVIGNAALAGAKRLACDGSQLMRAQHLRECTEHISLAELPEFARCYARNMRF